MSKGIFGGKIFGNKKKKIITIPIKSINTITRSCPVIYQGILMGHTESMEKIVKQLMEDKQLGFSEEEMVVTLSFSDKNGKDYYLFSQGRNIDAVQPGGYIKTYAYVLNNKYVVNVSLSIFVKEDTKSGQSRSKSFYDTAIKMFREKNSIS